MTNKTKQFVFDVLCQVTEPCTEDLIEKVWEVIGSNEPFTTEYENLVSVSTNTDVNQTIGHYVVKLSGFENSRRSKPSQWGFAKTYSILIPPFQKGTLGAYDDGVFPEGKAHTISTTRYERSIRARLACLQHHGLQCKVCGFDFERFYGDIGFNTIQVHHISPLSELTEETYTDPKIGLVPVCANCHMIIHKDPKKPLSVDELKKKIKEAEKKGAD